MCLSSSTTTVESTDYDLGQRQRREHDAAYAAWLSVGSTCGFFEANPGPFNLFWSPLCKRSLQPPSWLTLNSS
jgi:hypothetical protein